jgi:uncharacterized membrane protein (DUF441 family)
MLEIGVLSAIVLGIVQIAKGFGIPKRWSPILAIGVGIGLCFLNSAGYPTAIFTGLIVGLSAVGLYSGVKNTVQAIKE